MSVGKLAVQTLLWAMAGVIVVAVLLFTSAWTIDYWQAWVFIVIFVGCTNAIGIYLALKDPALLDRRRKAGLINEQRPAQRLALSLVRLSVLAVLVVSGLDHQFMWSHMPPIVSVVGDVLVALGGFMVLLVFRANTYGGSSIEIVEGQKVISSGPYAIVRHPMYVGIIVIAVGAPLALGSWWALLAVVCATTALIWRILDEETLLRSDLAGYNEYALRVRYRLVPFVW